MEISKSPSMTPIWAQTQANIKAEKIIELYPRIDGLGLCSSFILGFQLSTKSPMTRVLGELCAVNNRIDDPRRSPTQERSKHLQQSLVKHAKRHGLWTHWTDIPTGENIPIRTIKSPSHFHIRFQSEHTDHTEGPTAPLPRRIQNAGSLINQSDPCWPQSD